MLAAVAGSTDDCVHVDGTAGPCGTAGSGSMGPGFVDGETPAGLAAFEGAPCFQETIERERSTSS